MGLSGRKVKQRIPNDPRNLAWADDAAKFGSNYLAKFGWDSSKGLGVDGEGMKSHIKVAHKLDMLGIGAAHQRDPNGIAWKQSQDFEKLLARLNSGSATPAVEEEPKPAEETKAEVDQESAAAESKKKDKKRKKREEEEGSSEKKKKKKRKAEDEEKNVVESVKVVEEKVEVQTVVTAPPPSLPRHRAHRARAIASKNISSKSASAIAEILGIASSSSNTPSIAPTPSEETPALDQLTISSKSVADYFKEKLRAKSDSAATTTPPTPSEDDYDDPPVRMGLGAGSRLRIETTFTSAESSSSTFAKPAFSFPSFAASSTLVVSDLNDKEEESSTSSSAEVQSEPTVEVKKKEKKDKKEKRAKSDEDSEKKEKKRKKKKDAEGVDKSEEKRRKKEEKEERKKKKKSKEEKERT